ncbi:hypothetical protein L207DRAFT_563173 [Hyaloscypha variabilis F]|uniref:CmcJ-like methyltransferase n=1 Tax=Hyaloscypha variabilis (strain UAMH 11265 / GT02V1 / F) TaxID=1149755 RepID=A0A2J6S031_HYAVF|nr:hypothetical protein L207DRAFT_563173 [Hyaloscypha variabilis F]
MSTSLVDRPPIQATIYYLERHELYDQEKPYMFAFDVSTLEIEKTNHRYEERVVLINDARGREPIFELDVHGFCFQKAPTNLKGSDFDDDEAIRNKYYPEVREVLRAQFPDAVEIHIFAHLRRKRPSNFNGSVTEEVFAGPIVFAHADFSQHGALERLRPFLEENKHLEANRHEIINVWRVTNGPNDDWPLALCDYNTVALDDLEMSDVIHENYVGESVRVYFDPKHQWYFLSEQQDDEVVIFRNTDSRGFEIPFCLHLAFENTKTDSSKMRESIEVRAVCFFKDEST